MREEEKETPSLPHFTRPNWGKNRGRRRGKLLTIKTMNKQINVSAYNSRMRASAHVTSPQRLARFGAIRSPMRARSWLTDAAVT